MPITPITPLTSMTSIEPLLKIGEAARGKQTDGEGLKLSFTDMLKQMIDNVNETDAQTKTDAFNLAMGYTDLEDLHNIEINALKADLALRTVTSVRNKVLEAYTEIMRITV